MKMSPSGAKIRTKSWFRPRLVEFVKFFTKFILNCIAARFAVNVDCLSIPELSHEKLWYPQGGIPQQLHDCMTSWLKDTIPLERCRPIPSQSTAPKPRA